MSEPTLLPDGTPLPPMFQATLDDAAIEQLIEDIESVATLIDVRVKAGPRTRAESGAIDLRLAVELLQDGLVRGVQVTYRHRDTLWMDTLIRVRRDIRLVRTEPIGDGGNDEGA